MRKINSKFKTNYISEKGHLRYNKDYFAYIELDNAACWVLIEAYDDDMDNESAKMAAEVILTKFEENPGMSSRRIKNYIRQAHLKLKDYSVKTQLKASVTVVVSNYTKCIYATCGNTKLMLIREGNIIEKSKDQSLYQYMIDEGKVADDGEELIEENTNLFQFLGKPGNIKIFLSKKIVLKSDDKILLTTSGLWEKVSSVEMIDALENSQGEENFLENMQELVLSHQDEVIRSYTGVTIKAEKLFVEKGNKKKIIKYTIIGILVLILLTAIILSYIYLTDKSRNKSLGNIQTYESQGDLYIEDTNYNKAIEEYISAIDESEKIKVLIFKKDKETPIIAERLNIKRRITELITDGINSFSGADYNKASETLEKAIDLIIKENMKDIFDLTVILKKLDESNTYNIIHKLIIKGDEESAAEEYEKGLSLYITAEKESLTLKDENLRKEIKEKIIESNTAITDNKNQEIILLAQNETEQAEQYYAEGNMELATVHYANAYQYYESISDEDNKQTIKIKIKEIEAETIIMSQDMLVAEGDLLVEWGDEELENGNYDAAKENYKAAKKIYISASKRDIASTIDNKISDVQKARKEAAEEERKQEIAEYIEEGQRLEEKGDKALENNNFNKANEYYDKAKENYKSSGEYLLVQAINLKYDKITEQKADLQASIEAATRSSAADEESTTNANNIDEESTTNANITDEETTIETAGK